MLTSRAENEGASPAALRMTAKGWRGLYFNKCRPFEKAPREVLASETLISEPLSSSFCVGGQTLTCLQCHQGEVP